MKRKNLLISIVIGTAASLFAAFLMNAFTDDGSWLAFVGWFIFFFSITLPAWGGAYWFKAKESPDFCMRLIEKLSGR
jgi:Na+-driven multidrug efflux pump